MEMGLKHGIIQDVVVNHVYLGGDPPLVEELGFGSGPKGYALMYVKCVESVAFLVSLSLYASYTVYFPRTQAIRHGIP